VTMRLALVMLVLSTSAALAQRKPAPPPPAAPAPAKVKGPWHGYFCWGGEVFLGRAEPECCMLCMFGDDPVAEEARVPALLGAVSQPEAAPDVGPEVADATKGSDPAAKPARPRRAQGGLTGFSSPTLGAFAAKP
jgi:hypothetical protein